MSWPPDQSGTATKVIELISGICTIGTYSHLGCFGRFVPNLGLSALRPPLAVAQLRLATLDSWVSSGPFKNSSPERSRSHSEQLIWAISRPNSLWYINPQSWVPNTVMFSQCCEVNSALKNTDQWGFVESMHDLIWSVDTSRHSLMTSEAVKARSLELSVLAFICSACPTHASVL